MDRYSNIIAIIAKKKNGQQCTPEERTAIVNHVAETILQPGARTVWIDAQIQGLFPDEYGKGINQQEF